MEQVINLQLAQVLVAYLFVVIVLVILKVKKIDQSKLVVLATLRMTIQLVLAGYILVLLFKIQSVIFTLFILGLMELFAIYTIIKSVKQPLSSKLKQIIAIAIVIGTVSSLLFFIFVVVQSSPWYLPNYFIPIAGMLIGNSMTSITLGVNSLVTNFKQQKAVIEGALMLGATPWDAVKPVLDNSFSSAIIPTLNSMLGIGIVFLPGMMTGQILSGTSPILAIKYQIVIMLGIFGSVAITVVIFIHFAYRTFFNHDAQIINN